MERTVLVLNQAAVERLRMEGSNLLRNNEVRVIALPVKNADPFIQSLEDSGLLTMGSMLVQSPFDPLTYARADQANDTFALEKHFLFSEFCGLLGATDVCVQQIDKVTSKGVDSFSAKGDVLSNIGTVAAAGGVERERIEQFIRKMSLHDTFEGGIPDITAATHLLEGKRLKDDPQMKSLLRTVQSPNPILSREVGVNLSSESKTNLRIAASLSLSIPPYAKVDAECRRAVQNITEYEITYQVTFSSVQLHERRSL